jgi:hypothetical protein
MMMKVVIRTLAIKKQIEPARLRRLDTHYSWIVSIRVSGQRGGLRLAGQ